MPDSVHQNSVSLMKLLWLTSQRYDPNVMTSLYLFFGQGGDKTLSTPVHQRRVKHIQMKDFA